MKKLNKLSFLLLSFMPAFVLADAGDTITGTIHIRDKADDTITGFINSFISLILGAGGLLAMLFIILGGLQMVTNAANPKGMETGKKTLKFAILGLIIVIMSFTVFKIITSGSILGLFVNM